MSIHAWVVRVVGLVATALLGSPATAEERPIAEVGRSLFVKCAACHSVQADTPPKLGPHLEGIVGRRAASVSGYNYSEVLQNQSFIWNEARLEEWLTRPQAMLPGACMPFMGLSKPEHRKAMIAYLKNPAP